MKDSNILTLINIVKNSEKSQKDRDAFIDFVSKRQPMEPKSLRYVSISIHNIYTRR